MVDARDNSEGWHVHLSIAAQEGGAVLEAAPEIVERGASLVASAGSELNELVLFSRETDVDRAQDAVIDLYQRLRHVAGFDAQPARVISLERPAPQHRSRRPRHRLDVALMNEAARVVNSESHFEWAAVLAQTRL